MKQSILELLVNKLTSIYMLTVNTIGDKSTKKIIMIQLDICMLTKTYTSYRQIYDNYNLIYLD